MRPVNFLIISIIMFLMVGCSVSNPRPVSTTDSADIIQARELLRKQKEDNQPGPPPFVEKLEPYAKDLEKETKLYSMVFQEAPIGDILYAVTKDSYLNFIVENGVDLARPVTVNLKNVTFKEALDMAVIRGAGYA